jgi:pimeloyl-ACP methyl ester carboxylesterase
VGGNGSFQKHQQENKLKNIHVKLIATASILMTGALPSAQAAPAGGVKNIVIVHGALADGSGWKGVYDILTKDGYKVSIVQEPLTSIADDVAATQRVLDQQDGPVILVGHSYGGAIITVAGVDAKVKSLVYVAAVAPEVGESTVQLAKSIPAASNDLQPTKDGFLFLPPSKFAADFAADVPKAQAAFMATSQAPVAAVAFGTPVTIASWHDKANYGVIPTGDHILNPDLERSMYKRASAKVTEVKGASHAVYVSQPRAVASVIEQAALEAK